MKSLETGVATGFQPWGGGRGEFLSSKTFSGIRNKSKEKGQTLKKKGTKARGGGDRPLAPVGPEIT